MKAFKFMILILIFTIILSVFPAYESQEIIPVVLSNIELVTLDEDSASVTWVTNIPADTKVQWGETDTLGYEDSVIESTLYHIAWITGLNQGTTYFYRIGSGESWSATSSFETLIPPNGEYKLKFAIITDTHYDADGRVTPTGMMYADSTHIISNLVDELNSDPDLDLVMTMGDLTNGKEEDFVGFASTMDTLNVPWYPVLGNHDKTLPGWNPWFVNSTGYTDTYYRVSHGGYNIIIMDSAVQGQVSGDIDDDQLSWLEEQLDDHAWEPTLIFMHHLIDRTDLYGIDADAQSKINSILKNRPYVLSVNSGHIHQNIVTEGNDTLLVSTAAVVQYPIGYSKIKLHDDGFTKVFFKIESELSTSEESRVRLTTSSGNPAEDQEYLGSLEDRSIVVDIPGKPVNLPPVLDNIGISPEIINIEETAQVVVTASDPEGDELIFQYDTSSGFIEGSGPAVTYRAPVIPGTYKITVSVSDGELSSMEKSVEILVIEPEEPEVNHAPVIDRVTANVYEVEAGGTVRISVRAVDEDGDQLTYEYVISDGTIIGEGNRVDWRSPDTQGDYVITVFVSDGKLQSNGGSITLSVFESGPITTDTEDGLPGFDAIITIIAIFIVLYGIRFKIR